MKNKNKNKNRIFRLKKVKLLPQYMWPQDEGKYASEKHAEEILR